MSVGLGPEWEDIGPAPVAVVPQSGLGPEWEDLGPAPTQAMLLPEQRLPEPPPDLIHPVQAEPELTGAEAQRRMEEMDAAQRAATARNPQIQAGLGGAEGWTTVTEAERASKQGAEQKRQEEEFTRRWEGTVRQTAMQSARAKDYPFGKRPVESYQRVGEMVAEQVGIEPRAEVTAAVRPMVDAFDILQHSNNLDETIANTPAKLRPTSWKPPNTCLWSRTERRLPAGSVARLN